MSVSIKVITIRYKAIYSIGEADYEVRIVTDPANCGLVRDNCSAKIFSSYHKADILRSHIIEVT